MISNKAYAIYGAAVWLFGLIQSRMHMVWVDTVGGRMKTDYSYSAGLVYNTFPVPDLDTDGRSRLSEAAMAVLAAREQYPDLTLADIYDPDRMPDALGAAHVVLDETVDRLYRGQPFSSDQERLGLLFELYKDATAPAAGEPSHA